MTSKTLEDVYVHHIRPLSVADRLHLLAVIARDLAAPPELAPTRSLLELDGLGAEIWQGMDAQQYVNELRAEWDQRP